MKKLLALLIIAALTLSLVACGEDPTESNDSSSVEDNDINAGDAENSDDENGGIISTDGDLASSLAITEGETFSLKMNFMNMKMELFRDKDNIYVDVNLLGFMTAKILAIGDSLHVFDDGSKTYFIVPFDDEDRDRLMNSMTLSDSIADGFNADEVVQIGSGVEEFDERQLHYKEYKFKDEPSFKAFFENGDLVGVFQQGQEILFSISEKVPADTFDIPDDYKEVDVEAGFDVQSFLREYFG